MCRLSIIMDFDTKYKGFFHFILYFFALWPMNMAGMRKRIIGVRPRRRKFTILPRKCPFPFSGDML